ncbi:MAG TPA: hypothetical protein V6D47_20190 [Oscillatoriaceae cyanobacterium]
MFNRQILGLLLAAALAGCASAPPMTSPATGPSPIATAAGQGEAIAIATSQDMDAYGAMADDQPGPSPYFVQAKPNLTADIIAAIKVKVQARRAALKAKLAARIARLAAAKGRLQVAWAAAPWTDNADGSKTKTVTFTDTKTLNGKTWSRSVTLARTVDPASNVLVGSQTQIQETTPDGTTRNVARVTTLNADGSETVSLNATLTGTLAATVGWTEMIAAGAGGAAVSGSGTVTVDGKTINLTLSGTQGNETITGKTDTDETASVTAPADSAPSLTLTTSDGTATPTPVNDQDANAASSDASASGTATASATAGG